MMLIEDAGYMEYEDYIIITVVLQIYSNNLRSFLQKEINSRC